MSEELKPCPFCGDTPGENAHELTQGFKYGAIACGCGAVGPDVRTSYEDWPAWKDAAVKAWNERGELARIKAVELTAMSGVKRHLVTAGSECSEMVYASDYDRLAQECDSVAGKLRTALLDKAQSEAERDAALKQVEVLQDLLRKVAPHFAAPPGKGYLHQWIDAALEADT